MVEWNKKPTFATLLSPLDGKSQGSSLSFGRVAYIINVRSLSGESKDSILEGRYLFYNQTSSFKYKSMTMEIKTIPVLHGEVAARFVEAADEALKKRGTIDFSKQLEKTRAILKRSSLYAQ